MTGEMILVVEDNESLREGISEMLSLEGFQIVRAQNGLDALDTLRTVIPDLILSDVMMPGMDGFDFYSAIRSLPELISTPFIFLTARTDPADFMKGRLLGVDDYLAKPVTRDELVTAIRSRLSRFSQIRLAQVQQAYQASLTMLANAIEARGPSPFGHIERFIEATLVLASYYDWTERSLNQLRFGAILHDIGKLYVPEEILFKTEALTPEEWDLIKRHPSAGAEMVRGIPFLSEVIPLIRHHHERWDGAGYPDGLAGSEIPIGARILAVVDSFDAMVSQRAYAKQQSIQEAYDQIISLAGSQYDPEVVQSLQKAWKTNKIQLIYEKR